MSFNFLENLFQNAQSSLKPSNGDMQQERQTSQPLPNNNGSDNTKNKSSHEDCDLLTGPLNLIYESLPGKPISRGKGLSIIAGISNNREICLKKLKGKFFFLRKNAVTRNKAKRKTKNNTVSRKMIKKQKLFHIKNNLTYKQVEPMKQYWDEYAQQLLKDAMGSLGESAYLRLLRGDFHGAGLKIVGSTVDRQVGMEGIVLKESLKTFSIVTKGDKHVVIVKQNCVFEFQVGVRIFQVMGAGIVYRSEERVRMKPKYHNLLGKIGKLVQISDPKNLDFSKNLKSKGQNERKGGNGMIYESEVKRRSKESGFKPEKSKIQKWSIVK